MNIYRMGMHDKANTKELLASPELLEAYAHFSGLGTWSKSDGACKACSQSMQHRVEPLLVQWEPSSDIIGDFSWDGPWGYIFIVTEKVANKLHENGFNCEFLDVTYIEPEMSGSRKRSCVAYPYKGPKQFWGKCIDVVSLDENASGVKLKIDCHDCGIKKYTFRNSGIIIPETNWSGEKMFRIATNGKSLATFVTEEGKQLIEAAGLSNVAFKHAGQIAGVGL